MQYEITLPADYDMAIIRHRVATTGSRSAPPGRTGVPSAREGTPCRPAADVR
ncbi:DUF4865 family protein [Sphaerisporangium viridialbum]|uniref:DUF4865 family protein n=1 Tax=Sphaerisporangium viridialbum TaxID=46189 RepID=UPI003C77C193